MRFLISSVTCGDHLHRLAEIFSLALVVEHGLVNLAAGEIVQARELDVGEPLVMAEVEVGLRAVVEHINLAVLIRTHRAGVNVQIRVELLQHDLEAAVFEQGAERGGRQALAQRTHHAASDKNKFHFNASKIFPPIPRLPTCQRPRLASGTAVLNSTVSGIRFNFQL